MRIEKPNRGILNVLKFRILIGYLLKEYIRTKTYSHKDVIRKVKTPVGYKIFITYSYARQNFVDASLKSFVFILINPSSAKDELTRFGP